jgi:uncharacterized membrane protein YjjB (DUF3815 family)
VLAATVPNTDATGNVDFATTVKLAGIQFFVNGQPIPHFAIASASGTYYDRYGVHPAPEPSSAAAAAAAIACLGVVAQRRARSMIAA